VDLLQGLLLVGSIHLLAAMSPGPDFILVSQQTLTNGKKAGFLASIGIALGLSVHILYSSFGLSTIIANSKTAYFTIKILGGSYLIYLGVQGIRSKAKNRKSITKSPQDTHNKSLIVTGFFCNALNPKAPVYFVSLFTVILSPSMPLYELAIYGVWIMLIQFLWFSTVVGFLSRPAINTQFQKLGHWVDRLFGGAMVLIGIKVLLSR
jgi:RhtB (resistance to homoserine/threonine) family protein